MTTAEKYELDAAEQDAAKQMLEPGIFMDIPAPIYHRMDAVASHVLRGFYRTPAHAREEMLHPFDQTKAMVVGQALHTRVLELDRFGFDYITPPEGAEGMAMTKTGVPSKRDPKGKEAWAAWEARAVGRTVLTRGEMAMVNGMAQSIEAHPFASELLGLSGRNEVTVIWPETVEVNGKEATRMCKARIDSLRTKGEGPEADTFIIDLKSMEDASERGVEREVSRFNYHAQMAWYSRGLNYHAPAQRRVVFIAAEKDRPYCCSVVELDPQDLEQGERECLRHLRTLIECEQTGHWPGYDSGMGYVGLSNWKREA